MFVDGHTHICTNGSNPIGAIENIKREMEANAVGKAIVFPLSDTFEANFTMLDVIGGDPSFIPLAFINPHENDAATKFIECVEGAGMRGLKIHPTLSNFHIDDRRLLDPLFSYCNERHLNIVVHCTTDDPHVHPYRIETMARLYPQATFQIAHMGAIWAANAAIEVALNNRNVYLDTGIASMNAVRRAIDAVPNKVIMGCDFPFYTYALEQAKVHDAWRYSKRASNAAVLEDVMGNNAMRLYGGDKW